VFQFVLTEFESSGNSSISTKRSVLAVHNIQHGIDLYHMSEPRPYRNITTRFDPRGSLPSALAFTRNGDCICHASKIGSVAIYIINNGELFQELPHGESPLKRQ
jgi:hypothetical protein